jgi:hypothetical protein
MYEQLDMSIEDAIEFFAAARPDGIYKEHYVEALLDKYGGDVCIVIGSRRGHFLGGCWLVITVV